MAKPSSNNMPFSKVETQQTADLLYARAEAGNLLRHLNFAQPKMEILDPVTKR